MSLNQFLLDVGTELQELLWRDAPEKTLQHDISHLERHIQEGSASLARRAALLDEIRSRIDRKVVRESWLSSRVEVYLHVGDQVNAWKHALDLDRLRQQLQSEREYLQRQRRTHIKHEAYLQELHQQLADLHCQVY